jgi:hypothetical protein
MKNTGPNMAQPNDQQAHAVASDAKDHPLVLHVLWAVIITCSLAGMLCIGMGAYQRQLPHNAPVLHHKEHIPSKESLKMLRREDCKTTHELKHLTGLAIARFCNHDVS